MFTVTDVLWLINTTIIGGEPAIGITIWEIVPLQYWHFIFY